MKLWIKVLGGIILISLVGLSMVSVSFAVHDVKHDKEDLHGDEFKVIVNWKGIPISSDNDLLSEKEFDWEDIKDICLPIFSNFTENIQTVFRDAIPDIGYNNLVICLNNQEDNEIKGMEKHMLGAELYKYAKDLSLPYKFVIEATSDGAFHYAPMHGAVWSIIDDHFIFEENESDSVQSFTNFVDKNICTFRDLPFGKAWMECLHGVGHGLAESFPIEESLKYCDKGEDYDWSYSCSTGVYMEYQNIDPEGFHPCDQLPFSATCFMLKRPLFAYIHEKHIDTVCASSNSIEKDLKLFKSCVWGEGTNLATNNFLIAENECRKYHTYGETLYVSCMDGFLSFADFDDDDVCYVFSDDVVHDLCEYYQSRGDYFVATEQFYYNTALLEKNKIVV